MIANCEQEYNDAQRMWDEWQDYWVDNWDEWLYEYEEGEIIIIQDTCEYSNLRTSMLGSEPAAAPAQCTGSGACFCQGLLSTFGMEDISMPECPADFSAWSMILFLSNYCLLSFFC